MEIKCTCFILGTETVAQSNYERGKGKKNRCILYICTFIANKALLGSEAEIKELDLISYIELNLKWSLLLGRLSLGAVWVLLL